MTDCLIALGGNIDVTPAVLEQAVSRLESVGLEQARLSRCVSSRPMGPSAGGEFLNAAAAGQWNGTAAQLLATLHQVEAEFGRRRTIHWGPRTLDLDLILFGSEVHDCPELRVPHPAMWYRRFVLQPACDVAPEMLHPLLNLSVARLFHRLSENQITLVIDSDHWLPELRINTVFEQLRQERPQIEWTHGSERTRNEFAIVRLCDSDSGTTDSVPDACVIVTDASNEAAAVTKLRGIATAILG